MGRNLKIERFRQNATQEEWLEAVSDSGNLDNKDFRSKYGFTWSAIRKDAANRGYYQMKRNVHGSNQNAIAETYAPHEFKLSKLSSKPDIKARSVQLYSDTYSRLQQLENDYWQFTHTSILNQILDDGLKKYGY